MIKLPKDTAQAILNAYEQSLKPKSSLGFVNDENRPINVQEIHKKLFPDEVCGLNYHDADKCTCKGSKRFKEIAKEKLKEADENEYSV